MRRLAVGLPVLLACYLLVVVPFTRYMKDRLFIEKLGYTPQAEVLKAVGADQKLLIASGFVMKTVFYFGSLVEKNQKQIVVPPDYFAMYKTIETAVKLDPYNMDAYYFAQAVMPWEVGRVREANALLAYGMKYRTWDYSLPFYAGFNYAYFLKDYENAAKYYQRAAELSGVALYANLAGRYMYESGRTDLALSYVTAMAKSAKNDAVRKGFQVRIEALQGVKELENAVDAYRKDAGAAPASLADLVQSGYLPKVPVDPYGGEFYIDDRGQIRTTSNFAYAGVNKFRGAEVGR